jgi:uncharacterized membrane protein YqgA involved in biofilm formation
VLATIINVVLVLVGSAVGLLFKNLISEKLMSIITHALGLCVLGIGISNMIGTENMLCVIVCMVIGTVIGHAINIEGRLEKGGDLLRAKVTKGDSNSRFTEGFVNASLLFCVGAMAITGSIEAGLNHNYEIIISKGVIDGVTAISFAATMGIGVAFSVIPVLVYQGLITLLAVWVGPLLPAAVITEMTAVGGTLIVAIAINMLDLGKVKIKVGNMLPACYDHN